MLRVEVRDNTNLSIVAKKITPALVKCVRSGVLDIEREAKRLVPVDTGRLRSSITHDVTEKIGEVTGRVGTNVKYGPFVEYGAGQIGRRTAQAQGVYAPTWYKYGPKEGHYVPLGRAPGLRLWLRRKAGFVLESVGEGRYDIYYKGTNTLVKRAARYWFVKGAAQPYLTPAFIKHKDRILKKMENAVMENFR